MGILAADKVGKDGSRAAIWNLRDVRNASSLLEQFAGQVIRRTLPDMPESQLARIRLRIRNQLLQRGGGQ
jgi:hypothetical protein